jgi:hypothetical protein
LKQGGFRGGGDTISAGTGILITNVNGIKQVNADTEYLGDIFVLKAGDTMEGALIADAHEGTGLTPQVMNGGYCKIGNLPAVSKEGTFYFILP